MKTFRYELGHVHHETMTVGELVAKLSEYPADMPVMALWESVTTQLKPAAFAVVKDFDGGHKDDACDTLVIDVDDI